MRDHTHPATAFHALALVAAARAARAASRAIADRRAGRDPSEQEAEARVRTDLAELVDSLRQRSSALRLRAAIGAPEAGAAALAQAFEDRVLVSDLGQTLRVVHQKLLSLYPAVSETLAEDARQLAAEATSLASTDDLDARLGPLAARVARFVDDLTDETA